jgi:hypothetical protein
MSIGTALVICTAMVLAVAGMALLVVLFWFRSFSRKLVKEHAEAEARRKALQGKSYPYMGGK